MHKLSRHHVFWEEGWYRHPLDKAFRNHDALIIPTQPLIHTNLHKQLNAPPKPAEWMMHQLLDVLDLQPLDADPLWGAIACREYFNDLSHDNMDKFSQGAVHKIQVNLGHQVALLSLETEPLAA